MAYKCDNSPPSQADSSGSRDNGGGIQSMRGLDTTLKVKRDRKGSFTVGYLLKSLNAATQHFYDSPSSSFRSALHSSRGSGGTGSVFGWITFIELSASWECGNGMLFRGV